MAGVLHLTAARVSARQTREILMANPNQRPNIGTEPQGDNRQAGDVDGNRGADPKRGSQGVNESAGNQSDGTKTKNPAPRTDPGTLHPER